MAAQNPNVEDDGSLQTNDSNAEPVPEPESKKSAKKSDEDEPES